MPPARENYRRTGDNAANRRSGEIDRAWIPDWLRQASLSVTETEVAAMQVQGGPREIARNAGAQPQ